MFVSIFPSFKPGIAKRKLLTQFPASNENNNISEKLNISQIELFDLLSIYHKICYKF